MTTWDSNSPCPGEEQVFQQYFPLVVRLAKQYAKRTYYVDQENLVGVGSLALLLAIRAQRPGGVFCFHFGYLKRTIINAILNAVRAERPTAPLDDSDIFCLCPESFIFEITSNRLTADQQKIMEYLDLGYSQKEIGEMINKSKHQMYVEMGSIRNVYKEESFVC